MWLMNDPEMIPWQRKLVPPTCTVDPPTVLSPCLFLPLWASYRVKRESTYIQHERTLVVFVCDRTLWGKFPSGKLAIHVSFSVANSLCSYWLLWHYRGGEHLAPSRYCLGGYFGSFEFCACTVRQLLVVRSVVCKGVHRGPSHYRFSVISVR